MTEPRIQLLEDLGAEFARVAAEHDRAPMRSRLRLLAATPGRAVAVALGVLVLLGAGAYAVPPTRAAIDDITSTVEGWLAGDDDDITTTFEGWVAGDDEQAPGRALGPDAPRWAREEREVGINASTRLLAKSHGVGLYASREESERLGTYLEFSLGGPGISMSSTIEGWREDFADHAVAILGASSFVPQGKGFLDEQGRIPLMGATAPSVERLELRYEAGPPLVETGVDGGFVLIVDAWRPLRELIAYDADGHELERLDLFYLDLSYHCEQEPGDCPAGYARGDVPPGAGAPATEGFTYYKLLQAHPLGDARAFGPSTIEQWVAPDGSGRIRTVNHEPRFVDPEDEENWREQGSPALGHKVGVSDERFGPGELGGRSFEGCLPPTRALPADPSRLAKIFRKTRAVCSEEVPLNAKSFEYAVSVLFQAGSSRKLRAALHEVVTRIDGVELIGDARDPLGRRAVAVALDYHYGGRSERYELFFDPETSQPLAFTDKLLESQPFADAGVVEYNVLVDSGHVKSVESRLTGRAAPERLRSGRLIEALARGEDAGSGPWLALLGVAGGIALVALAAMWARRNRGPSR